MQCYTSMRDEEAKVPLAGFEAILEFGLGELQDPETPRFCAFHP